MACTSLSTRWATGVAIPAVCSTSSSRCRSGSNSGRRSVVIVAEDRPNKQGKKMARSPKGKPDLDDGNKLVEQLREWTEKSTTLNELDPLLMKIKKGEEPPPPKKKPTESKKGPFGF